ncbi:MAG: phosphoribosylanthranilate isomerase [Acidobacteriota bacterium]|jgi:phosphoribosylanthranilate isomerase
MSGLLEERGVVAMSGLRWKVCGITNGEDAAAAIEAGADALGFVLWPGSPRAVTLDQAAAIAADLPADVWRVGVFVDAVSEEIAAAAERLELDFVQLHGDETPQACAAAPRPVWKALRFAPGTAPETARELAEAYPQATLLIDARVAGEYGGTGEAADWEVAAHLAAERRVVLAGGLHAGNVVAAVERVRPWAVDVSSGVESAPGRKSIDKLTAFAESLAPYRPEAAAARGVTQRVPGTAPQGGETT